MFGFLKKDSTPPGLPPLKAAQLRPRIKHIDYLKTLRDAGVPPDQIPEHMPLCGELLIAYAFDLPDSFIMAAPPLLKKAGVKQKDVARLARENFGGPMKGVTFHAQDGCALAVVGGDMEASLLALNGVWKAVQKDIKGELLATAARRNRLLVCDSADTDAIAALRRHTLTFFHELQDQHCLSTQIMVRRDHAWTLFEPN